MTSADRFSLGYEDQRLREYLAVRFTPRLAAKIRQEAEEQGVTISTLIRTRCEADQ